MQRAFYFIYMNKISVLLWSIFILMLKPIDNVKVKTKIQHGKMRGSLKCFPTMKESKNHKLLNTKRVVIR